MTVADHSSPAAFLEALARRLRTTPERVPAARATEELLSWLETITTEGVFPQPAFLLTAARLVYEHARLVIGPTSDEIVVLARRLAVLNERRPQAAAWTPSDWQNLARLVLENRHLPTLALFSEHPPSSPELLETLEIPFTARYVDDPPAPTAHRLPSPPLIALLDRAQELLEATAGDIADVKTMVESLRTDPVVGTLTRRPPSRSDSANPSQAFCKSRSKSAN